MHTAASTLTGRRIIVPLLGLLVLIANSVPDFTSGVSHHTVAITLGCKPDRQERQEVECVVTSPGKKTMLIAYDGSTEARRALTQATQLLVPTHVEILTAWEPFHRTAARTVAQSGLHQADWATAPGEPDPAYSEALETCREGVALAESLGLSPRAHMVESETSVWSAIVDAAHELRPDVIVAGTRATTGWRSLWQTSTADGVLHNSGIPMFIVPPANSSESDLAASAEE